MARLVRLLWLQVQSKVFDKLYWFGQYSFLCQIAKYYENNDLENVNREIYALQFPVEIWKGNMRVRNRKGATELLEANPAICGP